MCARVRLIRRIPICCACAALATAFTQRQNRRSVVKFPQKNTLEQSTRCDMRFFFVCVPHSVLLPVTPSRGARTTECLFSFNLGIDTPHRGSADIFTHNTVKLQFSCRCKTCGRHGKGGHREFNPQQVAAGSTLQHPAHEDLGILNLLPPSASRTGWGEVSTTCS